MPICFRWEPVQQNFAVAAPARHHQQTCAAQARPSALVKEWLLAAEYCYPAEIIRSCYAKRGSRPFETGNGAIRLTSVRCIGQGTLASAVIADPSHGTGKQSLIGAFPARDTRWARMASSWRSSLSGTCALRRTAVARSFAVREGDARPLRSAPAAGCLQKSEAA